MSFASRFLGYPFSIYNTRIKNTLKFASKICLRSNKQKEGIDSMYVCKLWDKIEANGGIVSLTLSELRTFVMIVFNLHTLCRFSRAKEVKLEDLNYHEKYFEVDIKFSKTDQDGKGQITILPFKQGYYNPHKLMCLYIEILDKSLDPNQKMYIFPPIIWDKSAREWKFKNNAQIKYSTAYQAFKKLLAKFDFDPKKFGLHSPRIGGATEMFKNRIPKRIIDAQGRWKNRKTKYRYVCDSKNYIVKQLKKF